MYSVNLIVFIVYFALWKYCPRDEHRSALFLPAPQLPVQLSPVVVFGGVHENRGRAFLFNPSADEQESVAKLDAVRPVDSPSRKVGGCEIQCLLLIQAKACKETHVVPSRGTE